MLGLLIRGGPQRVRTELDELIRVTGADELIIASDTYEFSDRIQSFSAIAQAKSNI
jgi:hypothetical protein